MQVLLDTKENCDVQDRARESVTPISLYQAVGTSQTLPAKLKHFE